MWNPNRNVVPLVHENLIWTSFADTLMTTTRTVFDVGNPNSLFLVDTAAFVVLAQSPMCLVVVAFWCCCRSKTFPYCSDSCSFRRWWSCTVWRFQSDAVVTVYSTLQLFVFVIANDDVGIFLDSRDFPSSSRSSLVTDGSLPGTSHSTPSYIIYRHMGAPGSRCWCPMPILPNRTLVFSSPRFVQSFGACRQWLTLQHAVAVLSYPDAAIDDPSSYCQTLSLDMELRRTAPVAVDDASLSDWSVLPSFGLRRRHRSTEVTCAP